MSTRNYVIDGQRFEVEIVSHDAARSTVVVNGQSYRVEQSAAEHAQAEHVAVPAVVRAAKSSTRSGPGEVRAPMAGRVVALHAQAGDHVSAGAPLLVLDAMKMENTIASPHSGRVEELAVSAGDTVLQGALLARVS